jgi:DNA-binding GntR family transcriptional regulator
VTVPTERYRTLAGHAADLLREEILSGALGAGSRITLEPTAVRLGMSTIPVREALRSLSAEGLVEAVSQRGFRVSSLTPEDLHDTYVLRCVLDAMAVRLATPRLRMEDLANAELALGDLVTAFETDDPVARRLHHRRFHFAIYSACESPWLLRLVSLLWENSERYQSASSRLRGSVQDRAEEHRKIFRACESGDPVLAEQALIEHLTLTESSVLRELESHFKDDPHEVERMAKGLVASPEGERALRLVVCPYACGVPLIRDRDLGAILLPASPGSRTDPNGLG